MWKSLARGSAAIAIMALTLTGCGRGGEGTTSSSSSVTKVTIAYSTEALDETQTDVVAQMKLRAHQLAEQGLDVSVTAFGADNSVDRQNSDIESIVTRQADALVVTTVDPVGSVSAIEAAHEAGVKVVDVRGNLKSDKIDVVYKGIDEPTIGRTLADRARDYLKKNPKAVLRFGLIKGGQTFTTTHARVEGIAALAKEMPDRVQIVAQDYGDWTTEKATSLMEDWAVRYPQMNALATSSDEMTLGAVNVLRSRGTLKNFYILSVNGSDNGLRMIKNGDIDATVGFDFGAYGAGMIDAAVESIQGKLKQGELFDRSDKVNTLIDASNAEEFIAAKKARDEAAATVK